MRRTSLEAFHVLLVQNSLKTPKTALKLESDTESFKTTFVNLKCVNFQITVNNANIRNYFLLTQIYIFIQGWWFSATGLPVFIQNHCSRPQWGHKNTCLQTSLNNQFAERQWRFCSQNKWEIYNMQDCNKSFSINQKWKNY